MLKDSYVVVVVFYCFVLFYNGGYKVVFGLCWFLVECIWFIVILIFDNIDDVVLF